MNTSNQWLWDCEEEQTLLKPVNSEQDNGPQVARLVEVLLLPSPPTLKMEAVAADVFLSGWGQRKHSEHCGEMSDIKMLGSGGGGWTKGCPSVCFSSLLIPVYILFFLGTPAVCIHMESTESHSEFSCEPIRLRMCQDLPYNTTFMPNLLNHYDQQTAALAMEVSCSTHIFLPKDLEKYVFFYFYVHDFEM